MKIIHIISGLLLFLLIAVGSATAYELGTTAAATSDTNSLGKVQVSVVYGSNTITFTASDPNGGSADIKKIGFNIKPDYVESIKGNVGPNWALPTGPEGIDGLGDYLSVSNVPDNSKPYVVTVTLKTGYNVADLISKNTHNPPFETAVHVSWTGGTAGLGGSAQIAGPSIPEFSTIAAPVVAILGILFITQRRKEN